MGRYIIRRFLWMLLVLLVVSVVTFLMEHALPGGPFDREKKVSPEIMANLNARYRLDQPLWKQYFQYVSDIMLPHITTAPPSGSVMDDTLITIQVGNLYFRWMNFGPSYKSKSRSVNDMFREQLPVSMQLGVMALLVAIVIGLPMGILAALKQNTLWDYVGMSVAILGVSVPVIVLGPLMVWILGVTLKWLPPTGWGAKPPFLLGLFPHSLTWDYWKYAIMPSFALGVGSSAIIARPTRASLLQVIREDYIRTARAKGMARLTRAQVLSVREKEFVEAARTLGASDWRIMFRHILPNIVGPLVVTETLSIPGYISTEAFLSFIGLGVNPPTPSWGSMISDGAQALRSYPNQAIFPALALAITMFAFNFLGDGLRDAFDPRLRGTP